MLLQCFYKASRRRLERFLESFQKVFYRGVQKALEYFQGASRGFSNGFYRVTTRFFRRC